MGETAKAAPVAVPTMHLKIVTRSGRELLPEGVTVKVEASPCSFSYLACRYPCF